MAQRQRHVVAPGTVLIHADQTVKAPWRWGPPFAGGYWLIKEDRYLMWAFRTEVGADVELSSIFEDQLADIIWQLEHPELMAGLMSAEPTTRAWPASGRSGVPDMIADDVADLNTQARDTLG